MSSFSGKRHDGGDVLALLQRQDVDQRLAARLRRRERQPPHLFLVDLAARGEEQHRRVGRRHEQPGDEILVARLHAGAALAAALLRPVGRERHPLDVAEMGDGDDHVLALDQVLVLHLAFLVDDDGAARRRELLAHGGELGLDDRQDARARAQDIQVVGDLLGELVDLGGDLVAAERGQALQAQVEDGLGLLGRQAGGALGRDAVARIVDQQHQRRHVGCRPVARHQGLARRIGIGRRPDQPDHLVDIGDRDGEADQDMGAVARLAEQVLGAPRDHLFAERHEGLQHVLQVHHQRPAAVERHHVGAEGRLQRGEAVELVEHHVGHGVALDLDHHAIAVAVGFVAQLGDALDLLLAPQFADPLDHRGLVHLVGDLGDDDGFAIAAQGLDLDLAAHHDGAAAEMVGGADARPPENDAAGREIRPRHDGDQIVDAERRVVDQGHAGVDHLAQIVRRNVGRHADRDTAGAVDQKVGKARRQHHRLALAAVVVRLEIDRVLVDVLEQRHGRPRQPRFGVAHGRRRIAVDRAEIALPVDQRQAHGEILRHAHQRVVDRAVAVRVILTHHVADDARRFHVFAVGRMPFRVHRIEDAPMHRLEAVARVGQRPRHDHAHGVIEVGALHLLGDRNRTDVRGALVPRLGAFVVGQRGRVPDVLRSDSYSRVSLELPPRSAPERTIFRLDSQLFIPRAGGPGEVARKAAARGAGMLIWSPPRPAERRPACSRFPSISWCRHW